MSGSIPVTAFMLALASAVSWAVGNLLIKRLPKVNVLHLITWASLVPPLPAVAVSLMLDARQSLWAEIAHAPISGLFAPVYLGLVASVFAYAVWGNLLQRYSAGAVAPFALLAPVVGAIVSVIVYGERFGPVPLAGIACMLLNLAVVVVPPRGAILSVAPRLARKL